MQSTGLSAVASTSLAHARAAHLARTHGIRLLSIKGPVADHYRLRPPRSAADADVWVEPARFEDFARVLEAEGWHTRVARGAPTVLQPHSRTYIHDEWGCDIDLHHAFPGFFAPADQVFELLWSGRYQLHVGNFTVMTPSWAGAAMIAALRGLRNLRDPRHLREYELIVEALQSEGRERREAFYELARFGESTWALRGLLESTGLGSADYLGNREQRDAWEARRTYGHLGIVVWWKYVMALPWHRRPVGLAKAIWVPRAEIPRNDRSQISSHAEAWRYQTARWRRGVQALSQYLRRAR